MIRYLLCFMILSGKDFTRKFSKLVKINHVYIQFFFTCLKYYWTLPWTVGNWNSLFTLPFNCAAYGWLGLCCKSTSIDIASRTASSIYRC